MADKHGHAEGRPAQAWREDRDRFVAFAFCSSDLLLELDAAHKIAYAAGAVHVLLDRRAQDLADLPLRDLVFVADHSALAQFLSALVPDGRRRSVRLRFKGPFGATAPLEVSGYRLPELAERIFLSVERAHPAPGGAPVALRIDPATGLLDRMSFVEAASDAVQSAGVPGELTLLSLSDGPELEARLGPGGRRDWLGELGSLLRQRADGAVAGRLDDTHYGVLGAGIRNLSQQIAELAKRLDPKGIGVTVAQSQLPLDVLDHDRDTALRALLSAITAYCQRAPGQALPHAKLSDTLAHLAEESEQRLQMLSRIIRERSFAIAFQPIVDLRSRLPHHFEALIRFESAGLSGSPYELIVFAEEVGEIVNLDLAMCERVLQWLQTANIDGHRYQIAVNLSGRSVGDPTFPQRLHRLLERYRKVRNGLLFEITESARIADLGIVNEVVQVLRAAGHVVCLDDFGSDGTAFRYLGGLDVDFVKIDGLYVRAATRNKKARAMVRAVAQLCRELNVGVVGEMVEDEEMAQMLEECRIDYAQGLLFGRPQADIASFAAPRPGAARGARRA